MPRKQHSELAAGLFVIVAVGALVGVVLWMGAAEVFTTTAQTAVFSADPNQGGLGVQVGNYVQIGDDPIGKVVEIRFDPARGKTLYLAEIEREGVELYGDARARAEAGFIGGSRVIVTDRGSAAEGLAGREHPIALTPGGFMGTLTSLSEDLTKEMDRDAKGALLAKVHDIVDKLTDAAEAVDQIAGTVRTQVDPEQAESLLNRVQQSVEDLNRVTATVREEISRADGMLLAKIHTSADHVESATGNLASQTDPNAPDSAMSVARETLTHARDIAVDAKPKVSHTLTSIENTTAQMEAYTREDIAELLKRLRQTNTEILQVAGNFRKVSETVREVVTINTPQITEMVDNLTLVSADLKATAREVRRNPWRLLYRPEDKELRSQNIYDAARAFSAGAEQLDQAITKLNAIAAAHPEGLPADDAELQRVRRQVEESFEQFNKVEEALWEELTR